MESATCVEVLPGAARCARPRISCVEARDLLDHAHDAGLVPVALEVPPDAPRGCARTAGAGGRRVEDHAVQRLAQPLLDLGRHLAEDLFLRLEVVVEGPVREAGPLRDVGDPGVEEAVLLEDLLGRATSRARVSTPLRDRGPLGFSAGRAACSTRPLSFRAGTLAGGGINVPAPSVGWWTQFGRHGAHASFRCSRSTPDGVPPPEVTTAVLASATWRSPASWRSCVHRLVEEAEAVGAGPPRAGRRAG